MNRALYSRRYSLFVWANLLVFFTLFLAACGGPSTSVPGTPTPGQPSTPTTGTSPTTGVIPTTVPMPPTQISCPPAGTARGAVTARLVRGSQANVVYVQNQKQGETPIAGILKRYDITTKSETIIVRVPHTSINTAQVSADGQWVLFEAAVANRSAIQLVRMDGQGLQTLYCGMHEEYGGVGALQWSPDQKYVAFVEHENVYLLNVATGTYRLEVSRTSTAYYVPRTWLDSTHLYMSGLLVGTESLPLKLYLLDITSAHIQQVLNSSAACGDFDSSYYGTQLFTSECEFAMPMTGGPSSIKAQPATGGPATMIYSTPTYGITAIRMASPNTLLFIIQNTGVSNIDTSHNGLWKIDTDGTGLTRLTTGAADETTVFGSYTRDFWSTVSRDGTWYAVKMIKYSSSSDWPTSLLIGTMSGGSSFMLARGTVNTGEVNIAGWTTM